MNYRICSHTLQLLLVINTTLLTMEGLVGVNWQSCLGMMKGVRVPVRIEFASFQHHVGTLCQKRCIRMPFWHWDNQTNKFTSRACGRQTKVTFQGTTLWRRTEMEKLGWGQDQRLGVDPPPYNSNPLFPSYALTHCSDLTSPASPTLPPGKLQSTCGYTNTCLNRLRSAHPPHPSPALRLSSCRCSAEPTRLFSGRGAL